MKIYRIAREQYIEDLTGEGARLYGGRWNKKGDPMVYFSRYLSLCALEILVHLETRLIPEDYYYMEAEIKEEQYTTIAHPEKIIKGWNATTVTAATQQYGSDWLDSASSLGLQIPSVILPQETNLLINPKHPKMSNLKIIRTAPLLFDSRL